MSCDRNKTMTLANNGQEAEVMFFEKEASVEAKDREVLARRIVAKIIEATKNNILKCRETLGQVQCEIAPNLFKNSGGCDNILIRFSKASFFGYERLVDSRMYFRKSYHDLLVINLNRRERDFFHHIFR